MHAIGYRTRLPFDIFRNETSADLSRSSDCVSISTRVPNARRNINDTLAVQSGRGY